MSTKRGATTELNDGNWDKEEKPEEKGVFETAPEEELKTRVIKKARRKLSEDTSLNDGAAKSVFSSFTGFTKPPSTATNTTTASPFSFLSQLSSQSSSIVPEKKDSKVELAAKSETENFQFEKSSSYYAKLKGLNQAVLKWIKKHVEENPLCILTPIFTDYEKYLKEIDKENEQNSKKQEAKFDFTTNGKDKPSTELKDPTKSTALSTTSPAPMGPVNSSISFPTDQKTSSTSPNTGMTFTFGQPPTTASSTSVLKSFSFIQSPTTSSSGFSFTGSKPFSFSASVTSMSDDSEAPKKEGEEGEVDDESDVGEFIPVVEEDSVYSKKCKVFVQERKGSKEGKYSDRGVGTLYLKPVKESEKTQLLVRADTNLGNILLNLILNDTIPIKRIGKNNVMMVCVPTAESEQKPTPVLLRVKTSEEADELLEIINKYKK